MVGEQSSRAGLKWTMPGIILAAMVSGCGEDTQSTDRTEVPSLFVVSPHPDDETIMGGGLLYRAARDGSTKIDIIYLTAGDAAGRPGP